MSRRARIGPGSASHRRVRGPASTAARPASAARLWRRHGRRALEVADLLEESPELGQPLSAVVDCSAAEVMVMARHEHILTMEDFLRRRTMLAMLETAETLQSDPGVERAAGLLFGSAA